MPEARRWIFQNFSLVCEQLSHGKSIEPYEFVINELLLHLKSCMDSGMATLSEEIYELLGDCCLARYQIEREAQHANLELPEVQFSYREVMLTLIGIIKRHNSFI